MALRVFPSDIPSWICIGVLGVNCFLVKSVTYIPKKFCKSIGFTNIGIVSVNKIFKVTEYILMSPIGIPTLIVLSLINLNYKKYFNTCKNYLQYNKKKELENK